MKIGEITVDASGRIVLPKSAREAANLSPGDSLSIELVGTKIILEIASSNKGLKQDGSVLVFVGDEPFDGRQALEQVRQDRLNSLASTDKK